MSNYSTSRNRRSAIVLGKGGFVQARIDAPVEELRSDAEIDLAWRTDSLDGEDYEDDDDDDEDYDADEEEEMAEARSEASADLSRLRRMSAHQKALSASAGKKQPAAKASSQRSDSSRMDSVQRRMNAYKAPLSSTKQR